MSRGNRLRDWHPQTVLVEVQDKILYYPRCSFLSPCEQSYVASCESAVFYQLCHKSNLCFADSNWIKVGKTLFSHINVNSNRGFESCPFVGYEVEPPACQCSLLVAHGQWTLDFPGTGRILGRRVDVAHLRPGTFGPHGHRIDFCESAAFYQVC
jgi:hypothetical protein